MGDGIGALPGLGASWTEGSGLLEAVLVLGEWAIPAFWVPLLLWTAWALVGFWVLKGRAGRASKPLHPLAAYRVGQVLVFMLPVLLVAGALAPESLRELSFPARVTDTASTRLLRSPVPEYVPSDVREPSAPPVIPTALGDAGAGVAPRGSGPDLTASVRGGVPAGGALLAGGSVFGLVLALVWGALGVRSLLVRIAGLGSVRTALAPLGEGRVRDRLEAAARGIGLERGIDWRVGPPESVPMTFGIRRPVVALPEGLFSDPLAMDLALRHELVHVRRHDFAWALGECVLAALFSFHPLVERLVRFVADARERSCDLEVLGAIDAPRQYGTLLVQMADRPKAPLLVAAGLSPSSTTLKERLETMSRFNGRSPSPRAGIHGTVTLVTGLAVAFLAACVGDAPQAPPPEAEVAAEAMTTRFGPMTDGTREEVLQRLELQVNYLVEQMDVLENNARNGDFPRHLSARYELLNSMYVERLEQYETLRMEAEVNRQLGVS